MDRRTFLRSSASVASVSAIAGCSSLGILGSTGPFTVTIDYPGSWGGSVGSEDGQRSVQGSGTEQFEIEGDIVSAVAQKRDTGSGRLTVTIAVGDNVVKRQSTTARFGAVSVSHRRGGDDEVSGNNNEPQEPSISVPELGDSSANVVVTVFKDFACPPCRRFTQEVFPQIQEDYISEGIIVYQHRNFPIPVHETISRQAPNAAHAVQDAAGEAAFYEYASRLFENQDSLGPDTYAELTNGLDVSGDTVRSAVEDGTYDTRVERDREYGGNYGVRSTPTVWVNRQPVERVNYSYIVQAIESARN